MHKRFLHSKTWLTQLAAGIAILVGSLVLIGWMLDIPSLKSIHPDWVTMKPITAVFFVLSGVSLGLLQPQLRNRSQRRIGQACASFVTLLGLIVVSQYLFGWNTSIKRLVFPETPGAIQPFWMAFSTALNFSLICGSLLLLERSRRTIRLVQGLAIAAALVALQSLMGYTYGVEFVRGFELQKPMALHTALTFVVLSVGILSRDPKQGLMSIITSDRMGGFIVRRLLLAAIGIPFLLGWLIVFGYRIGWYDPTFGLSLLVLSSILFLSMLILLTADTLDRLDTKRQQAKAALRESEEKFRATFNQAAVGIAHISLNGRFQLVNQKLCQIAGYTESELLELTFQDISYPDDLATDLEYVRRVLANEIQTYSMEKRYIRKDRSLIWVNLTVSLVREQIPSEPGELGGTEIPKYFIAIVEDISDRKQIETERNQLIHQLQTERSRLETVIQSMPGGVVISEAPTGKVILANNRFEETWGHPLKPAENIEEYRDYKGFYPDGKAYQPQDWPIVRSLTKGEVVENEEVNVRRDDGTMGTVLLNSAPIRDANGSIIAAVLIVSNITDRKQAEAEREQLLAREQAARAEAETANRLKDEFLATLSHELRTPMNAILGWISMIRDGRLDAATTARALETIERNTRTLNQLIEDILDVSRIIRGKLNLNLQPLTVIPTIEAAIDTVLSAAAIKDIQIETFLDPSVGTILGDPHRLQQIVWNLLSNAVKFTPKGGRVEVRLQQGSGEAETLYAEIQVRDTGMGIRPDFLPFVFERFRQADGSIARSHGGLGLGLAIVRHLVELHGGTVSVESAGEGQGATFTVKLPLLKQSSRTTLPSTAPLEVSLSEREAENTLSDYFLDGLRVLVVDDEADTREFLEIMLSDYKAEVIAVANADDAVEVLQQFQPHILVSDIGMPGQDGYSLIQRVRALPAQKGGKTPAVALTAYASSEDRIRALSAGFQQHIPKPVNPDELVAVLASLAERRVKV